MEAGQRYRHLKRGSTYALIGIGRVQADEWFVQDIDGSFFKADDAKVALYRADEDGSLWVRPIGEFSDGRFELIDGSANEPVGYLSPSEAKRALGGLSAGKVAVITGPETLEPRVGVYLHPMPTDAIASTIPSEPEAKGEAGAGPVGEAVAWRWRYYGAGVVRPWTVRQTPVAPLEPRPGMLGIEVEPLYARPVEMPGEVEQQRAALVKIDAIRNSIIGFQKVGWSEHIYPLVAALHEAGFEGEGYEEASTKAQTLLDRVETAEAALAETRGLVRDAIGLVPLAHQNWHADARAALSTQESSAPEASR